MMPRERIPQGEARRAGALASAMAFVAARCMPVSASMLLMARVPRPPKGMVSWE